MPDKWKNIKLEAWTDGACRKNPGAGGWGVVFVDNTSDKGPAIVLQTHSGGHKATTNNRMEMMAVIKALRLAPRNSQLTIYSDSQYVVKGITEWIHGWERRAWKSSTGEPVKNKGLWKVMKRRLDQRVGPTKFQWVKGHNGAIHNEVADRLAVEASHRY